MNLLSQISTLLLVLAIVFGYITATFHSQKSLSLNTINKAPKCQIINPATGRATYLDCLLDPETVEGPYYLPLNNVERVNMTEGHPGVPLEMTLIIVDTNSCEPIPNAAVDVWHANASGIYSGYEAEGTLGETFLRARQITNTEGSVHFQTIFPGWYTGRSLHAHIEVYIGGAVKHIGQFFFTNNARTTISNIYPYSNNSQVLQSNIDDWIYNEQNGAKTVFTLTGSFTSGLSTTMYVGVDNSVVEEESNNDDSGSGALSMIPQNLWTFACMGIVVIVMKLNKFLL